MLPATLHVTVDAVVTLRLTVTNDGTAPAQLRFGGGQQYEFIVRTAAGAPPLWRWSDDRMFAQALTEHVLAAGERWTIAEAWHPTARGPLIAEGLLTDFDHSAAAIASFTVP